jgi:hypothetical protein
MLLTPTIERITKMLRKKSKAKLLNIPANVIPEERRALETIAEKFSTDGAKRKFYSIFLLGHQYLHPHEMESIERVIINAIGRDVVDRFINPTEIKRVA